MEKVKGVTDIGGKTYSGICLDDIIFNAYS
jgi:hypothetical protein